MARKRYEVYYYDPCTGESDSLCDTDSPKVAIEGFFKSQADYPSCVAIMADRYLDADILIEWAHFNRDTVIEIYNNSKRKVYKLEYILEAIENAYNIKKYKIEDATKLYMDQVHPFDLG